MVCQKCGNQLPNEGFVCKFCGAMMTDEQIEQQKNYLKERHFQPKLKSELYGIEKINYQKEEAQNNPKIKAILIIVGVIIFLIILAILINIS